jgi:S-formylglutathione hydrolase FrmB
VTEDEAAPSRRLRDWLRPRAPWLLGLVVAAVAVELFYLSGTAGATNDTLQIMGFDPDRANLLVALIAAAMAAAIIALAGGPTALGVLAGLLAGTRGFGHTALSETRSALNASGTQGTFDALGWTLSIVTFVVAFAVTAWAAAILAREARRRVIAAVVTIRELIRGRDLVHARARFAGAVAVILSVAIVAAVLPVFGDMLNYDPDVHMRQDAVAVQPLFGSSAGAGAAGVSGSAPGSATSGGTDPSSGGAAGTPVAASTYPAGLVAGPLPGSLVTPGAVSSARPWATSLPTGHGRVTSAALPAPWTGGIRNTIGVDVYLPPGYDAGSARYPVIFEGPDAIATWQNGMRLPGVLDSLITSGAIPPEIVVFVSDFGGPYADSECANSFDGTEWIDRFMATDLVHWVDTSFRTIATPASRATFGFSLGGYCAAALLAHHPDVFNSAVVLSGYFVSGIHSGTTPNAWRPFNNDPAIIAATSPMTVVPRIPPALGSRLFVTMTADPTQGFYGPQMAKFAAVLHGVGASMAIIPSTLGHSWDSARQFVPTMLEELAGRMVTLGVFGPAA